MEGVVELPIKQLITCPLVDPRRHLDQDRVRRYSALIDQLPPVTVFRLLEDQTLLMVDGYHRVAAAQLAGRTSVQAEIRAGTKTDAMQYAVDLAAHERGATDTEARAAIRRYTGRREDPSCKG